MAMPRLRTVDPTPLLEETIPDTESSWSDDERIAMVAENAYYRAEARGFMPGYEIEDWLAAEREIGALLARDR